MGKPVDIAIVVVYLVAMLAFGFWGKTRTKDSADFLVAGRRLGPTLYTGTMAAVVLGGASTVGGVGLGYKWGVSGMWLVVAIAVGLLALSLFFAGPIQRLRVYTVAQMLSLRYGVDATSASGLVMAAYTLMLSVTSTIAYATVFNVLFGTGRTLSVVIGGMVVMLYSSIGGMWSITLTDMVQFVLKTVGVFFLLLPFTWHRAGGFDGIRERAGDAVFSLTSIGTDTIITFFVVYSFGMLIGQDIWQRVFTARSPQVARWGGTTAAIYCVFYGIAGALIGLAASTFMPDIEAKDDVYAQIAEAILPVGISGIVLAAAVAAMMSTASGALIATATVARTDIKPMLMRLVGRGPEETENPEVDVHSDRRYVAVLGVVVIIIAALLNDVVGALTIAYDILVGGLLVPILGGFLWKRATGAGALAAMAVGTLVTLGTMAVVGDVLANEPIYFGLVSSLITYVGVSLATPRTSPEVLRVWDDRLSGHEQADVPMATS
ncbi:sodium:solute symporter [Mycolicibacterium fortuitum]|uniref:Sodium:solute symporter n=2 Tax=Mycolicibacterium fortuitum TaxID=1766 RepID=A0AAE5ABQ8_MYCFO|nr:sodium:solute symporter [Mycolicibacterium fortuitum]MDV7189623.1 sodium:solute symporter [Mycolicibacterium fortuitum]MDV7203080.1 sodium:solute symporter [Mycolicibacterium fortuitum]MDV7224704.1 sodium:solute symporter [Mycolicibacterium fortuitum]MDV7256826.1 sodium:solute symporter [Mycolicibacterium fortuitum]MDV7281657.1 sodium:solute symporter [Mycolicibacterium fortuitum]